jgi:hypothetical protein
VKIVVVGSDDDDSDGKDCCKISAKVLAGCVFDKLELVEQEAKGEDDGGFIYLGLLVGAACSLCTWRF